MYGIELLGTSVGAHDGSYMGLRYFRTAPERASFVKESLICRKLKPIDFAVSATLQQEIEKIRKERKINKAQRKKENHSLKLFHLMRL